MVTYLAWTEMPSSQAEVPLAHSAKRNTSSAKADQFQLATMEDGVGRDAELLSAGGLAAGPPTRAARGGIALHAAARGAERLAAVVAEPDGAEPPVGGLLGQAVPPGERDGPRGLGQPEGDRGLVGAWRPVAGAVRRFAGHRSAFPGRGTATVFASLPSRRGRTCRGFWPACVRRLRSGWRDASADPRRRTDKRNLPGRQVSVQFSRRMVLCISERSTNRSAPR